MWVLVVTSAVTEHGPLVGGDVVATSVSRPVTVTDVLDETAIGHEAEGKPE